MIPWHPLTALPPFGVEESEYLDFKAAPWGTSDSEKSELLRDVAQFANHLGGSVILGAVEDGADRLLEFKDVADPATVIQRVRDLCHDRLSPRPEVGCLVLRAAEGAEVVVVNVRAVSGVVAIRAGERWEFYRRDGKCKKPMAFEEVEKMWSEGRRGKLILANVPKEELSRISLDMPAADRVLTRDHASISMSQDYFTVCLSNRTCFNCPYEFVRGAWPAVSGGWTVSLTMRLGIDTHGGTKVRAGYAP